MKEIMEKLDYQPAGLTNAKLPPTIYYLIFLKTTIRTISVKMFSSYIRAEQTI